MHILVLLAIFVGVYVQFLIRQGNEHGLDEVLRGLNVCNTRLRELLVLDGDLEPVNNGVVSIQLVHVTFLLRFLVQ